MDGNVWRPAHLTPEQMEERRLEAARLLRQGRLSQAEIARQLGPAGPVFRAGPPPSPRMASAVWRLDPFRAGPLGSMRRPGFVWVGSWIGAPWRRALPPSAGPSSVSRP